MTKWVREFWTAMGREDTARLGQLIAGGVDVNQPWPLQDRSVHADLISPLLSVASTGKVAVAQVLLDHGADVHGGNRWLTPILWAAAWRHEEMVSLLQQHGAKETILVAAALGRADRVTAYLRKNAKLLEQRDERGETPLHYAALALRAEVVALLLKKDADVDAVDALDIMPLHLACDVRLADPAEQLSTLKLLIQHGANVNAIASHDLSPLHRAARARNPAAVKLLLDHGAAVDARDARGSTPLRRAVSNTGAGGTADSRAEAIAIVKLLMQAGANGLLKNREGKTVLGSARDAEIRRLLRTQ